MTDGLSKGNDKEIFDKNENKSKSWNIMAQDITSEQDVYEFIWPEEELSRNIFTKLFDCLFYSYMNRILKKGSALHKLRKEKKDETLPSLLRNSQLSPIENTLEELGEHDLYQAPSSMRADLLHDKFQSSYENIKIEMLLRNQKGENDIKNMNLSDKENRLLFIRVLFELVRSMFIRGGFWQLISTICQIMVPICVHQILTLLEENPKQSVYKDGIIYAVLVFFLTVMEGIAQERHKFLAFQSGILLRSSVINAVYNHVLMMTPDGRQGLSTGEVTNLVAVDSQKLFEVMQEAHLVWSCPLSMIAVTLLLLLTMGPSTIVGMIFMFLMVPFVHRVILRMMKIRKKRTEWADKRIEVINSMLLGIKFTKLSNYESKFTKRIHKLRANETKYVQMELTMIAITMVITVLTPVLACAVSFTTYVLMDDTHILTASKVFTTLFLFSVLRFPINYFGKLMGKAAQGLQACSRFGIFFSRETVSQAENNLQLQNSHSDDCDDAPVTVVNGNFTVGNPRHLTSDRMDSNESEHYTTSTSFTISNINFSLKRSETLAIVGPVGSGKTSLIKGLIGDLKESSNTSVKLNGTIAYASQTPFILNATIRENILFGLEYDEEKYQKVLEATCLLTDLKQIGPSKDLTEIGERGVTLSGGQKARVSLARCVYSNPDICIFDDPLSALDATTGKRVFENVMKSSDDLMKNTTNILVTHTSHFLHRVDKIMLMVSGKPAFLGNWDDLSTFSTCDPAILEAVTAIRSSVQEDKQSSESSNEEGASVSDYESHSPGNIEFKSELMEKEEREFGLSNWRTWLVWFKNAGGFIFIIGAIISLGLDRFSYVVIELWLATWASGAKESVERFEVAFAAQSEGRSAQYEYLKVYVIILIVNTFLCICRSQWIVQGGLRCSEKLFTVMLSRVVYAPMSYFDSTPIGRIMNRFTYDIETLDITLSQAMTIFMISIGWFFAGVILQSVILPWIIFVLVPITFVYWMLTLVYRKTAVDLQRLDAVSRSPIQSHLSEGFDGSSTIRIFKKCDHYKDVFQCRLNQNCAAMMNYMSAQRWLAVRIHLLGSLVVLFATVCLVTYNDVLGLEAGIAGILIIWGTSFTITLSFFVQSVSDCEAYITSVERVKDMAGIAQESSYETEKPTDLSLDWPTEGNLRFENVMLRYRKGMRLALDGLSFEIKAGQRCGVVGRTGAGKSTLTTALFRIVEIESGNIFLDGIDLASIGLSDVRGREHSMTIIPQDPVLFSGSLRECLDPFGSSTDEAILEALKAVRIANVETRGVSSLDDFVDEGGSNFSVGERQLLCLARAILNKPKVLVLDEATASVDTETDIFIQKMLRSRFHGTTLLTIAHRLNTIMDYDVVLAMENGKAKEFGPPNELLKKENGLFNELVKATGKESSKILRLMASQKSGIQ